MENFYEKMHLDMAEAAHFEPPWSDDDEWWQDKPYGEEQANVEARETRNDDDEDNTPESSG